MRAGQTEGTPKNQGAERARTEDQNAWREAPKATVEPTGGTGSGRCNSVRQKTEESAATTQQGTAYRPERPRTREAEPRGLRADERAIDHRR